MCNCIEEANKELAKHDTTLTLAYGIHGIINKVLIATENSYGNKRKKPMKIFASFCPFCGEEYKEVGK